MIGARRTGLVLAVIAALATLTYAASRVRDRGRFAVPYSTYSAGPEGARGLFLLARSLGHDARPVTRELTHLPRGTLVLIAGCQGEPLRAVARPEREAITRWVEDGGLLIVAGRALAMPDAAGLSTAREAPCVGSAARAHDDVATWQDAVAVGPPLTHMLSFKVHEPIPLRVGHDALATEILTSTVGPIGLTAPFGRGRLVLLGIPDALTNRSISDGGGLVFARLIKAFAPDGPVLFDEYHLGMGARRSVIGYLRDRGYASLLLQLLGAVLVALLVPGVRLARVAVAARELPGARRTFFDALTALYARTHDRRGALSRLAEHALGGIAQHHQLAHLPQDQLSTQLHARGLHAVAGFVERIREHAARPLLGGETLHARADQIARDESAALALTELAAPGLAKGPTTPLAMKVR